MRRGGGGKGEEHIPQSHQKEEYEVETYVEEDVCHISAKLWEEREYL